MTTRYDELERLCFTDEEAALLKTLLSENRAMRELLKEAALYINGRSVTSLTLRGKIDALLSPESSKP